MSDEEEIVVGSPAYKRLKMDELHDQIDKAIDVGLRVGGIKSEALLAVAELAKVKASMLKLL